MIFLQADRADAQSEWRTLMVLGFLLVVTGELALCAVTLGPAAAAGGPLGLVLVVTGALHLYPAARGAEWVRRDFHYLASAVYAGAGVWLLLSPSIRAGEIMPLLAGCFIAGGALQIYVALTQQQLQPGWTTISGGVTALLGVAMLAAWPHAGIATVAEFAALESFVAGSRCLGLAWSGWQCGRDEGGSNPSDSPSGVSFA